MHRQYDHSKTMQSLSIDQMFRQRFDRFGMERKFILKDLFVLGMRADWILTDEERINKKMKIEENRRLRRLLYPDSSDTEVRTCDERT